jgi:hypothetical protein
MAPPQPCRALPTKRIIRLATHDEVSLLGMKREEEDELLFAAEGSSARVTNDRVDAEYQFDRQS